jgi:hypothetical protein
MLPFLARLDRALRGLVPGSRGFLVACAIPALAVVATVGSLRLPRLVQLAASGTIGTAMVTGRLCTRHATLRLRLDEGSAKHGEVEVRVPASRCGRARVGERVEVTYLAADPAVAAATGHPVAALARELALVLGVGGVGTFAGVALVLRLAHRTPG